MHSFKVSAQQNFIWRTPALFLNWNKNDCRNMKKERLDEELKQLRAQIALLLVKQEQLEASGLVSDLKLQTEMQKERVKEAAKKWASIQMVRHVIRNKMERHKKSACRVFWRRLENSSAR